MNRTGTTKKIGKVRQHFPETFSLNANNLI